MLSLTILCSAWLVTPGCGEKEPAPGPSQPAPRTPNKTPAGDGEMTPEQLAGRPQLPPRPLPATPSPAPGPGSGSGDRATTNTPPTNAATPAAPAPTTPAAAPSDDPVVASFAGLTAPKPATWQYRAPAATSTMRVAEYIVPGVEGSDQAQIIVYHFAGGGSVEANIDRWKTQFRTADGTAVVAKTEQLEADGMKVTVAELSGDYRGMGKSEFAPDQILLAGMIETDGNPVFVQLVGPSKTVQASRAAFMDMMRGVKRDEPMK